MKNQLQTKNGTHIKGGGRRGIVERFQTGYVLTLASHPFVLMKLRGSGFLQGIGNVNQFEYKITIEDKKELNEPKLQFKLQHPATPTIDAL